MICRNPEYMRPSKRGAGKETKETAKAELTMPDGGVISGISAVNEKMTELLGIRKEQFTQIAMIPQGDFLKLLLSGTKERAAIFREIFNTRPYLQLQEQLKKEAGTLYNAIKDDEKVSGSIWQKCAVKRKCLCRFFGKSAKRRGYTGYGLLSGTDCKYYGRRYKDTGIRCPKIR